MNETNLGLSAIGNNWKYAVANFLLIFGVQVVFSLNDLMNQPETWPTLWFVTKSVLVSAATTLIFYGYNKVSNQKAAA